jgi:hypothetical protein
MKSAAHVSQPIWKLAPIGASLREAQPDMAEKLSKIFD